MVKKISKVAQSGPRQSKKGRVSDAQRRAKSPGLRRSKATGNTYYETRRNRSDADRRKNL